MRPRRSKAIALLSIPVLCFVAACQLPTSNTPTTPTSPGVTLDYSRIVIATFDPTGDGFGASFDMINLYSESGASSATPPYTYPDPNALASDNHSNPDSNQTGYAYIDYSPPTPLPSGTVLYVRVAGYDGSATGYYGISVTATAPNGTYPVLGVPATSANEPDNTPTSTGVPTIGTGQSLSSYLSPAGDVDWIKIVLPYG